MSASCKLPLLAAASAALLVAACVLPQRVPPPPPPAEAPAPHAGEPYDVVATDSLLSIRVYRAGTLASAGHNHLIACHALSGTLYVPEDLLRSSFEVRVPVAELTVDEAPLRAAENSADFPPQVPDAAREGTRHNMLGEALLDGAHHPQIVLRAVRLEALAGDAASVLAHVEVTVRGQAHAISLPVSYQLAAGQVIVSGEAALKQSELGLTPFSALLGALAVQDEMRIRFRILARSAASGAPR